MTNSPSRAALSTLILALSMTSAGSFLIFKGIGGMSLSGNFPVATIISLSIGTIVTSCFYTGLHRGLFLKKVSPFQDFPSLTSYVALVQTTAVFLFFMKRIPEQAFYLSIIALQSWMSWLTLTVAKFGLNVKHPATNRLPWAAAISTGIFGILIWPARNFWPLHGLIAATAIWQASTTIAIITATWLWFALHPKYRLRTQDFQTALMLRLKRDENRISPWLAAYLSSVLQMGALLTTTVFNHYLDQQPSNLLVLAIHFHIVPCLFGAWGAFTQFGTDKESFVTLSRLAAQSAKRLLKRQSGSQQTWATTIGLKTATFTIDHDPESQLVSNIPATLMRIRNDEIFNILSKITQNQTLSLTSVSQKILGTIDPEQSSRPCVDALNLCATLHLDAGPIIERRISGLVALLPIVNPGLSASVNASLITALLKRSHWFFHFDFTWVDQSLINTPSATRYGIQIDPVSADTQWALLTEMRKTHSIGNFLWIGHEAHERLLQEAPHIASIAQPHVMQNSRGEENLLFIIKFEQLIPRLQRYYGLDTVRSRIIDYEPSPEAQRLLSLLSLQITAAKTLAEKRRIVDTLTSYQWHGFKEKDHALKLLQKLYHQEVNLNTSLTAPEGVFLESFTEMIKKSISLIGYPSQILNQAHIHKIELRNIPNLSVHALNPTSLRFEEAWVLMSNLNFQKLHADDAKLVRELIQTALKEPQIMQMIFVHAKMIDAAVALGRRQDSSTKDLELVQRVLDVVIDCGPTDESLALAMDGIKMVSQKLSVNMTFSVKSTSYFESRMTSDSDNLRKTNQAIISRWQEYRAQSELLHIQNDVAS